MRQGRRVRRVIRRVEPSSVLRLSALFYVSVVAILLVAGTLLWLLADLIGIVDNVETFIEDIGFDDFHFLPGRILRGAILGGAVLVLVGSGLNLLLAVLYNLIADMVGGIEVTVLEPAPTPAVEEGETAEASEPVEPAERVEPAPTPASTTPTPTPDRDRLGTPSGIFGPSGETAERSLGL